MAPTIFTRGIAWRMFLARAPPLSFPPVRPFAAPVFPFGFAMDEETCFTLARRMKLVCALKFRRR